MQDEKDAWVISDGHLKFIISGEKSKEVLYQKESGVKSTEFGRYEEQPTGNSVYGYSWIVDSMDVKEPADTSDSLTGTIELTLPDGKVFNASSYILSSP